MYRRALAKAAEARGWAVYWYEAKSVFAEAAQAMGVEDFDVHCNSLKKDLGPPWGKDQKLAMAAAIVIANQVE